MFYFVAISITDLTVMLMWLLSGGEWVGWRLHSTLVQLIGPLDHYEGTHDIRGGGTLDIMLSLDPKPSRELPSDTSYHDNTSSGALWMGPPFPRTTHQAWARFNRSAENI